MTSEESVNRRGTHTAARRFSNHKAKPRERHRSEANWSDDNPREPTYEKLEREYLATPLPVWPHNETPEAIAAYSEARQKRYELWLRAGRLRRGEESEEKPLGFVPIPHDSKVFLTIMERVRKGQKQSLVMAHFCRHLSRDAVQLAYVQAKEIVRAEGVTDTPE